MRKQWILWTEAEKRVFQELEEEHGTDFDKYQAGLPGRSLLQIKSFFYNQRKRAARQQKSEKQGGDQDLMELLSSILRGGGL